MTNQIAAASLLVALLLPACSAARQGVVNGMVDEGMSPEDAECVVSSIEEDGFGPIDLIEPIAADAQAAIDRGVIDCLDTAEIGSLTTDVEIRKVFRTTLLDAGLTNTQVDCVLTRFEADGYSMNDMLAVGLGDPAGEDAVEAVSAATASCISER